MGRYRLLFAKSVAKDLRSIPNRDVRRIRATFDTLSENPRGVGSEKLSGEERYRIRQGDFRIVCEVQDDDRVVKVVRVGHRREVYRRT